MMEPGIYEDLPEAEYWKWPAVHQSDVKVLIDESPMHYRHAIDARAAGASRSSKDMRLGTALHRAVLEPERFDAFYIERPECDRRNKLGKEKSRKWMKANLITIAAHNPELVGEGGELRLPVKGEDTDWTKLWELADRCSLSPEAREFCRVSRETVWGDPALRRFFEIDGRNELSFLSSYAEGDWSTLVCSRTDRYLDGLAKPLIVDLKKTARSAHPVAWQREIANRGYHRQAAWYLDRATELTGVEHANFAHLVFEDTPPYAVAIYILAPEFIQRGREENARMLGILRSCEESGEWPGYSSTPRVITEPRWYKSPLDAGGEQS